MITLNDDNKHYILDLIEENNNLVVACLCAAWCDTCNAYKNEFNDLSTQMEKNLFLWIDIEDHPDYLGDCDIENFPTILIQNKTQILFFGEQLPFALHLKRLIETIETQKMAAPTEVPPLIQDVIKSNT